VKSRMFSALLLAAALMAPGMTRADEALDHGLSTMWEALWHQSGTPTRLVRWEGDIYMRLAGIDVATHRETVLQAMTAVTQQAGIRLFDVTDRPDVPANLSIDITANTALEDNQPCVTVLNFRNEVRIDGATVQMRSKDAWRCAHHEAMHVMGVRGHPAGHTVLSYFPSKVDELLPLDKTMLKAWYSPRMRGGMTPFEAMAVMADELVATQPDKVTAAAARDRFLAATVDQMHAFAGGQGDIPEVVRRSGKSTDDGIRWGRAEMSYFLGVAYLQGAAVAADRTRAIQWLERAASAGNRRAQAQLGSFR
jgi:hypothetical protein